MKGGGNEAANVYLKPWEHSKKLFDLSGRVAIVTKNSGGIGLGMTKGLARAGTGIVLAGLRAAAGHRYEWVFTRTRGEVALGPRLPPGLCILRLCYVL